MKTIGLASLVMLALGNSAFADDLERNFEPASDRFTLSAGFEYASGDYGSPLGDTDDWYVPFSLGYSHANWRFKLTLPYLTTTGPGNVIGGGQDTRLVLDENRGACTRATQSGSGSSKRNCTATTAGTTRVKQITESGLGDVTASALYSFDPITPALPSVDIGAKIKFPTADLGRGLGAGAYGYTLTLDLYKPWGEFALLGGVAYTFKGDIDPSPKVPSGLTLDNVLASYVGAEYRLTDNWLVGVSVD